MAGDVVNIKVFSSFKLRSGLKGNYHEICHYSYNLPLATIRKMRRILLILIIFNTILLCNCNNKNEEESNVGSFNSVNDASDIENLYESITDSFITDDAKRFYVHATYKFQSYETDSALYLMRKAFELDPKNKLILKDFGIIFQSNNQLDSADFYVKKSLMIDSTKSVTLSAYGLIQYAQNRSKLALEYYNKALKHTKGDSTSDLLGWIYYNKAIAFEQLGMMDSICICLYKAKDHYSKEYQDMINQSIIDFECK